MLKRSGPFDKKQLIEMATPYADLYDGRVPYLEVELKKEGYVIFEKMGVYWKFKKIQKP